MNTTRTKLEIIEETIKEYSDPKNRASDKESSYYYKDGKMCAIGRCLKNPERFSDTDAHASHLIELYGDEIFKEEYRGHSMLFWDDIQFVHDNDSFFDENGMNNECFEFIDRVKQVYKDKC